MPQARTEEPGFIVQVKIEKVVEVAVEGYDTSQRRSVTTKERKVVELLQTTVKARTVSSAQSKVKRLVELLNDESDHDDDEEPI